MKKIYLPLFFCMVLSYCQAQKSNFFKEYPLRVQIKGNRPISNGLSSGCDTISPTFIGDSAVIYLVDPTVGGFVTGTNGYGDLAKAQYFDVSSSKDNYLTEVYIYFGAASTKGILKQIPVDIIDGTGHKVGGVLGTAYLTMDAIVNDVNNARFSHVVFNSAIKLPTSKQFYVSVNMKNLSFLTSHDTLAIVSSPFNKGSGAWDKFYDGTWMPFVSTQDYGLDLSLYIYPLVSPALTCIALPVQLTQFTAQASENGVLLNWQVAQELNMKQYIIEKAGSNLLFAYAGSVDATNLPYKHTYAFTDANAVQAISGNLFYRLKQINKDGSLTYSNVIQVPIGGNKLLVKLANPFNGALQMHINSPEAQKIQVSVFDILGRKVVGLNTVTLAVGDNFINLPTGSLAKGLYILNITAANTVFKYKIVNE